ncbi:hypothetical protein BGX34_011794, partial [Mortierella sp. NVP85]
MSTTPAQAASQPTARHQTVLSQLQKPIVPFILQMNYAQAVQQADRAKLDILRLPRMSITIGSWDVNCDMSEGDCMSSWRSSPVSSTSNSSLDSMNLALESLSMVPHKMQLCLVAPKEGAL